MAFWLPWRRVLVCGDYLSPVEIPMISPGGTLAGYLASLQRLQPLIEQAQTVVPGHGAPLTRDQALKLFDEDQMYLVALRSEGSGAQVPASRRSAPQRRIHVQNAERVAVG